MKLYRVAWLMVGLIFGLCPRLAWADVTFSFTTLNDPQGTGGTVLTGISGNNIVGWFANAANTVEDGFLYNGSTFTTIADPLAGGPFPFTNANGIDGSNVVGVYFGSGGGSSAEHGFLFNGSTYTTLDDPLGVFGTYATGISGNTIVGVYYVGHDAQSFIYNGGTYTTLSGPTGAVQTFAESIDGNNIVGYYIDNAGATHGFLFNGSTYTILNDPSAVIANIGINGTRAFGISGNNIVGVYSDSKGNTQGFLYNGSTFTTISDPSAQQTEPLGISGGTIVGFTSTNTLSGFVTEVTPEPSSLTIFGTGLIGLPWAVRLSRRRQRR